jgi:hypothetical protein
LLPLLGNDSKNAIAMSFESEPRSLSLPSLSLSKPKLQEKTIHNDLATQVTTIYTVSHHAKVHPPNSLSPVFTQHALTTQLITVHSDNSTASATTYFTAMHFGTGQYANETLTAYGKYVDHLVKGEHGSWKIERRMCNIIGRSGNPNVMTPVGERT